MLASPPTLIAAIISSWSAIESTFETPAAWKRFSAELLRKLRDLDEEGADQESVACDIATFFARYPAANALLSATLQAELGTEKPAGRLGSPWATTPKDGEASRIQIDRFGAKRSLPIADRHTRVSVLYGTDRTPAFSADEPIRYSAKSADTLSFGIAEVSVPDVHGKGRLERPRWYRLEFRENPDKHIVLTDLRALDYAEFVANARAEVARDGAADEALIFVHGYNVSFEAAILRTAQLACDLDFPGIAVAYSWPSEGTLFGYGADANATGRSMFQLAEFIRIVQSGLGLQCVHVIAHSIGSRILASAMDRLALTWTSEPRADIHQLVFAAPDIDPKTFEGFAETFMAHCKRCTLYAASRDLALFASKLIYRHPRAGDTSHGTIGVRGVDTIDATNVDTPLVGHSYFGDRRSVLADLYYLLVMGWGPDKRFGLSKVSTPFGEYWKFDR
jgi:esterase/lipase superfamily enzyme